MILILSLVALLPSAENFRADHPLENGVYSQGTRDTVVIWGGLHGGNTHMIFDPDSGWEGKLVPSSDDTYQVKSEKDAILPLVVHLTGDGIECLSPGQSPRMLKKFEIDEREVAFTNGDIKLGGTVFGPKAGKDLPGITYVHGSGPSSRYSFVRWGMYFARFGIVSICYDKRGVGSSTGDFQSATLADLSKDAESAFSILKSDPRVSPTKLGFYGTSQGPWITAMVAQRNPAVAFLIHSTGGPISGGQQELYRRVELVREAGYSDQDVQQAKDFLEAYFTKFLPSNRKQGSKEVAELFNLIHEKPWFKLLSVANEDPITRTWGPTLTAFAHDLELDVEQPYRDIHLPILAMISKKDPNMPVDLVSAAYRRLVDPQLLTLWIDPEADHQLLKKRLDSDPAPRLLPDLFFNTVRWVNGLWT